MWSISIDDEMCSIEKSSISSGTSSRCCRYSILVLYGTLLLALIALVGTTVGFGYRQRRNILNNHDGDGIVYDPTTTIHYITLTRETTNGEQQVEVTTPEQEHCPVGLFQCSKSKLNTVHQSKSNSFVCIGYSRVCDGVRDCPEGQDEFNCTPTTTPAPSTSTTEDTGCYLCAGTQDLCIPMSSLCNHRNDCPQLDDETNAICGRVNQPNAGTNVNIESNFSSNQSAPTNIYIINNQNGSHTTEHRLPPMARHSEDGNSDESTTVAPSDDDEEQTTNIGRQNVGFMFHVDNFVVYNSQLKMFNQDSENLNPNPNSVPNNGSYYRNHNGTNGQSKRGQFNPERYRQQSKQ